MAFNVFLWRFMLPVAAAMASFLSTRRDFKASFFSLSTLIVDLVFS
jgi:hypothetical protein